jgi:tetratricopeptide (TPR) repeat protein
VTVDSGPLAVDRLKNTLKDRPKASRRSPRLSLFRQGRHLEAVDAYREAEELSAPLQETAAALRQKGVKPSADLPAECRRSGPEYGLALIASAAASLDPPHQLRCLESALEMGLGVSARRGNAFYLIGNPDSAMAEHRKVLARSKDYPESLFFVGAILLEQANGDKKRIAEGKKYWQRLLQVAPDSPRAATVRETLPRLEETFRRGPEAPHGRAESAPGGAPLGEVDVRPVSPWELERAS